MTDSTGAALTAWLAEHPVELTPWERRINEAAFDVPDWLQLRKTWLRDFGEDW